jgi:hypothetical protein
VLTRRRVSSSYVISAIRPQLDWSASRFVIASASSKCFGLFALIGHSGYMKWYILPFIRKKYGPFPGGDLISAPIDAKAIAQLFCRIRSL